ncbi:hypothetical protein EU642_22015 [Salmonella enterica]|nr:hypothetical protein [Salmonella enterica]EAO0118530.1 hypothetical protein [Salmonella enterica]EAO3601634.1 hypothetical protein [Salmonella enterica]EAR6391528.1 hypothetical protein [Salmonella enterica]EAV1285292.1 hypothetical protein [Salmonella enterica]
MPTTLTDSQKADLASLLDNLNLSTAKLGFGEIFISILDGKPINPGFSMLEELRVVLNNLNLTTAKLGFGDLIVSQIDKAYTAPVLTEDEKAELSHALMSMNVALAAYDFGTIAVTAATVPSVQYELVPDASAKGTYKSTGANSATLELVEKQAFSAIFQEKGVTASGDGATLDSAGDATIATAALDAATHKITITGVKPGDSTVTIKNQDGNVTFTLKVKIKVTPPVITAKVAPTDFRVNGTDIDLATLFTVVPAGATLTYKTDGESKAKIDATKTKLQAVAAGDVKVTASAPDAVDATVTINVKPANGVVANKTEQAMVVGEGFSTADMFTVTGPVAATYSVDNANVTLNPAKTLVTGAVVGEAVLTATVGSVTATVKLKVNDKVGTGLTGRGDILGKKVGDTIPVTDVYMDGNGATIDRNLGNLWNMTPAGAVTYSTSTKLFTVGAAAANKDVTFSQKEPGSNIVEFGHITLKNVQP